jgi:hypothetical protein
LGLVGKWWSGQEHRVLSGIDGVLLVVVIGEGKLVVPVDFVICRPDPKGPGGPCGTKQRWVQVWIKHGFRTLKHLLATEACQIQSEEAYYGHLVLRLMGCFVLFYTSRVICYGRITMEAIIIC